MNLLITGGLGGIGRELVESFVREPATRIITLSRRASPHAFHLSSKVQHEAGSLLDEAFVCAVLRKHNITHVIHAAGARTRECEANPALAYEANVLATDRLLCAVRDAGAVKRFIHFSSAAVYGGKVHPVSEDEPLSPSTNYAIAKAASEMAVRHRVTGSAVEAVILRPGFVVGRYTSGLLSELLRNIANGHSAALQHPEQFHLHWAADVARAAAILLRDTLRTQEVVYHLPGRDCSIHELAQACAFAGNQIHPVPNLNLPQRLEWAKFRRDHGEFQLTELSDIRQLLQKADPCPA